MRWSNHRLPTTAGCFPRGSQLFLFTPSIWVLVRARFACPSHAGLSEDVQVWQVPVPLVQVEPVPDEELVRDREADVPDREVVDQSAVGPIEERRRGERARLAEAERADEEVERQSCVHNVLDHEHLAVGDPRLQVLEQLDAAAAAVGRELEEVQLVRDLERAREIGQKDETRFQRRHENRVRVDVVAGDFRRELADAAADLLPREVDLADATRRYDASSSLYRSAKRSMSRL